MPSSTKAFVALRHLYNFGNTIESTYYNQGRIKLFGAPRQ